MIQRSNSQILLHNVFSQLGHIIELFYNNNSANILKFFDTNIVANIFCLLYKVYYICIISHASSFFISILSYCICPISLFSHSITIIFLIVSANSFLITFTAKKLSSSMNRTTFLIFVYMHFFY